ncbi:hypothetical protein TNCV_602761 [Trichonephila clavipes]|nr:hypothetical protein TNCV_602761 [Trichonephila clavipes]
MSVQWFLKLEGELELLNSLDSDEIHIEIAVLPPDTSELVTGSHVFSLTCPLDSLGPELMATLFQSNPRSEG